MLQQLGDLFWNTSEHRLRAGIRVCIYFGLWGFGPALLHLAFGQAIRTLGGGSGSPAASIYLDLLRLAAVLIALYLVGRFVDHRPFAAYGFRMDRRWWLDLIAGMTLGVVLMAGIFVIEWAAGWVNVVDTWVAPAGTPFWVAILPPLVLFIVVAIAEEVLSRGNQLLNFTEGFVFAGRGSSVLLAWLLSSLIFGALHFSNPNSSWVSTLYLVLYGVFLGAAFVFTGQLALPIGLHFTWNLFQGNVFGFPVSGRPVSGASVLSISQAGPQLWTGGAFGPEAGLLGVFAAVVGIGIILLWVRLTARRLNFELLLAQRFQVTVPLVQKGRS